jgi:hypothetical protein
MKCCVTVRKSPNAVVETRGNLNLLQRKRGTLAASARSVNHTHSLKINEIESVNPLISLISKSVPRWDAFFFGLIRRDR